MVVRVSVMETWRRPDGLITTRSCPLWLGTTILWSSWPAHFFLCRPWKFPWGAGLVSDSVCISSSPLTLCFLCWNLETSSQSERVRPANPTIANVFSWLETARNKVRRSGIKNLLSSSLDCCCLVVWLTDWRWRDGKWWWWVQHRLVHSHRDQDSDVTFQSFAVA